eukprot:6480128-Amphidinium_carterae.7
MPVMPKVDRKYIKTQILTQNELETQNLMRQLCCVSGVRWGCAGSALGVRWEFAGVLRWKFAGFSEKYAGVRWFLWYVRWGSLGFAGSALGGGSLEVRWECAGGALGVRWCVPVPQLLQFLAIASFQWCWSENHAFSAKTTVIHEKSVKVPFFGCVVHENKCFLHKIHRI